MQVNEIICGDCADVMKDWPENCVDLTITSPPYDNLRDYNGYEFNYREVLTHLYRITKAGGVVVWVVGDATIKGSETGTSFRQALCAKDIGFNLHDTMIYEKSGFSAPMSNRYHQIFEYMFIFSKGKPKTFNLIRDRKNIWSRMGGQWKRQKDGKLVPGKNGGKLATEYGMRFNIWRYANGGGHVARNKIAHQHPAIFPERLATDHILSWSNSGDLVLDPMCGSGTTCVAAKRLHRNYIGIDISETYCSLAKQRIQEDNI